MLFPLCSETKNNSTADSSTPKGMNPQNPNGAGRANPRKNPFANSAPARSGHQPHVTPQAAARQSDPSAASPCATSEPEQGIAKPPRSPRRRPSRALRRHKAGTKPPPRLQPSPRAPRSRPESVTFFRPTPRPESVTFSAPVPYPIFVTPRPARSSNIRDLCRQRARPSRRWRSSIRNRSSSRLPPPMPFSPSPVL